MFSMLVVLVGGAFWAPDAAAAVELAVPEAFPASTGALDKVGYARYLATVAEPDQVVAALDARVRCVIADGWLRVEFAADASNWPSLPLATECTLGTGVLPIDVVAMSEEVDPSKRSWTLEGGHTARVAKVTGSGGIWSFPLPAGSVYRPGEVASTLSDNTCVVVPLPESPGEYVVQIRSPSDADLGTGACSLPREGEEDFVLNVALSEHAI